MRKDGTEHTAGVPGARRWSPPSSGPRTNAPRMQPAASAAVPAEAGAAATAATTHTGRLPGPPLNAPSPGCAPTPLREQLAASRACQPKRSPRPAGVD